MHWVTDEKGCFSYRACLIDVFTEPRYGLGDLSDGWALMTLLSRYRGGDLCITEMERRFVHKLGSISLIRGGRFEHYSLKWDGTRFCLVSAMH